MDVIIEQYGSGPQLDPANNNGRLFLYRSTMARLYKSLSFWNYYPRHVVCTICTIMGLPCISQSATRVYIGVFDLTITQ